VRITYANSLLIDIPAVIPNIPFFFCVWRAWSHWRAYKASDYLEKLLESGAIAPKAHEPLDEIYTKYTPKRIASASSSSETEPLLDTKESPSQAPETSEEEQLLTKDAVKPIIQLFDLPDSAEGDMNRALDQARKRKPPGTPAQPK
jgi:hypothetical protein